MRERVEESTLLQRAKREEIVFEAIARLQISERGIERASDLRHLDLIRAADLGCVDGTERASDVEDARRQSRRLRRYGPCVIRACDLREDALVCERQRNRVRYRAPRHHQEQKDDRDDRRHDRQPASAGPLLVRLRCGPCSRERTLDVRWKTRRWDLRLLSSFVAVARRRRARIASASALALPA
jgi:hypothetical protein